LKSPTFSALPAPSLLRLIWLASPALPIGGFSYSEGLEAAVDAGLVSNEAQASDWLLAQLQFSQARSDLAVVAQALTAWRDHDMDRVRQLNGCCRHGKPANFGSRPSRWADHCSTG
jgi:urease accessory protein